MSTNGRTWTVAQHAKFRATMKARRALLPAPPATFTKREMTVNELLIKLRKQKDFMVDVVNLLESVVK